MSKTIFILMLNEVLTRNRIKVNLSDFEKEQLYRKLLNHFGLIGGLNVCEALESAWLDPYNKRMIEDFIIAWLERKMLKRPRTGII